MDGGVFEAWVCHLAVIEMAEILLLGSSWDAQGVVIVELMYLLL